MIIGRRWLSQIWFFLPAKFPDCVSLWLIHFDYSILPLSYSELFVCYHHHYFSISTINFNALVWIFFFFQEFNAWRHALAPSFEFQIFFSVIETVIWDNVGHSFVNVWLRPINRVFLSRPSDAHFLLIF